MVASFSLMNVNIVRDNTLLQLSVKQQFFAVRTGINLNGCVTSGIFHVSNLAILWAYHV